MSEYLEMFKEYPVGSTVVGYRYGKSPASGYSHNYATGADECGVSMASAGNLPESRGFATMEAKESRRRYYYRGVLAGTGGDDEICLTDCQQISRAEYLREVKQGESCTLRTIWANNKALAYYLPYYMGSFRMPQMRHAQLNKDTETLKRLGFDDVLEIFLSLTR